MFKVCCLTAAVLHRYRAAAPEKQTPADTRAQPGLPAPSALQQPTQPSLPPARHPLLYEAPLPPWPLRALSLSGPLQWLLSHGHPNSTCPYQQAPWPRLWLPPPCRGPREAPQDRRQLQDIHPSLHFPSLLPQLSLILSSPTQRLQLQTAPRSLLRPTHPRSNSPQPAGRGQLLWWQLPHRTQWLLGRRASQ